jgi:DNA-directed RNA polymerase beta' subunit
MVKSIKKIVKKIENKLKELKDKIESNEKKTIDTCFTEKELLTFSKKELKKWINNNIYDKEYLVSVIQEFREDSEVDTDSESGSESESESESDSDSENK